MALPLIALTFLALLVAAYHFYGRWLASQFGLDDSLQTPAHVIDDGVDFVPAKPSYLFAQHFSAIAAAGPIAGPILACQTFGWLPCLLWIAFGVVLIGAVHDFTTLAASVRHRAQSVAEIVREQLGPRAGVAMMAFIWIALVYVIVAFADITSGAFVSATEELQGASVAFNAGGAVAASSLMYLTLSVLLGFIQKYFKPPLWLVTVIFVPATFGVVWLGTKVSTLLLLEAKQWGVLILVYCAIASMVPVWALLQPRGYLGGYVLYTALALGVVGIFFGGYEIAQPAFKSWDTGGMAGTLFPFLFVTIACGACSGFHGLVCSGTTSKQIDQESHIRAVGYGGMLAEAFVALISLVTVMIVSQASIKGLKPGTIYGNGIGEFLTILIGKEHRNFAITFGAMAFSTFVFDTLDVSTRLGRYIVQELFRWRTTTGAIFGTILTVAVPVYFVAYAPEGSWVKFWTLFGASNQLLAALSLLAIAVWLHSRGQRVAYVLLPMIFVLVITLWALVKLAAGNIGATKGIDVELMNAIAASALVGLALYLVATAWSKASQKVESSK